MVSLVDTHTHTPALIRTQPHTRAHTNTLIQIRAYCMHTDTYVHSLHTHMCRHTHIYIHTDTCIDTLTGTYTYTRTHAYACMSIWYTCGHKQHKIHVFILYAYRSTCIHADTMY